MSYSNSESVFSVTVMAWISVRSHPAGLAGKSRAVDYDVSRRQCRFSLYGRCGIAPCTPHDLDPSMHSACRRRLLPFHLASWDPFLNLSNGCNGKSGPKSAILSAPQVSWTLFRFQRSPRRHASSLASLHTVVWVKLTVINLDDSLLRFHY